MVTREQLISRWRDRLADCEAEVAHASVQRRWLKLMYVRVFRFLLARYGSANWTAAGTGRETATTEDGNVDDHRPPVKLADLRSDTHGTPPKSVARIRQTLETIHDTSGASATTGPRGQGLSSDDWIVVASRRDGVAVPTYAAALRRAGLRCRRRRLGRDAVVEVRYKDEEEALMLLRDLGDTVRQSPSQRTARREGIGFVLVAMGLGAMMGTFVPLVVAIFARNVNGPNSPAQLLAATILGTLAGGAIGGMLGLTVWKK
jgi:hypothetical protein